MNKNIFFYDIYTYNIDKLAEAPVIHPKVKGLDINEERLVVEAQAAGEILMAICQNKSITFKFNSDHSHGDPRTIQRGLTGYNDISQYPEKGATSFAVIGDTQVPIAYDSKYCTYAAMFEEEGYYGYVDYKIITGTINNQWTVYLNMVDHGDKTKIYILLKDMNEGHSDICLGLFYISLNQQGEIKFFIDELPEPDEPDESYKQFEKTQSDFKTNVKKARKEGFFTEKEKNLRASFEMVGRLTEAGDYDEAERHAVIADNLSEQVLKDKSGIFTKKKEKAWEKKIERKILEGILVSKEIDDINLLPAGQKELIKVDRERIPNLCILLDTLVKNDGKKFPQQEFKDYIRLLLKGNNDSTELERETLYLSEKINKGPEIDKEEIKKHARLLLVFDNSLNKLNPELHGFNTDGLLPDGVKQLTNGRYVDENNETFDRKKLLDRAGKKLSNILQGRISKRIQAGLSSSGSSAGQQPPEMPSIPSISSGSESQQPGPQQPVAPAGTAAAAEAATAAATAAAAPGSSSSSGSDVKQATGLKPAAPESQQPEPSDVALPLRDEFSGDSRDEELQGQTPEPAAEPEPQPATAGEASTAGEAATEEEKTKAFLFLKYILMLETLSKQDNTFVTKNLGELTSCMNYVNSLVNPAA